MRTLQNLFNNNQAWATRMLQNDPEFFRRLLGQQQPSYLWIGCSDSRVPANEIVGLLPGELFVHRNIANVVVADDLNCQSVLQFAVELLHVKHVIVCGHYGCSGIEAALHGTRLGLADHWLENVVSVRDKNRAALDAFPPNLRRDRLCELNVIEQVAQVCNSMALQNAWAHSQSIAVHGWIYGLEDGRLRDLDMCVTKPSELAGRYEIARAKTVTLH